MTTSGQRLRPRDLTEEEASRIDMEAFDRLPAAYRDLIRDAPVEIPATVARAYLAAFGQRLGLQFLKWAVKSRLRQNRRSAGDGRRGNRRQPDREYGKRRDVAGRLAAAAQHLMPESGADNER
jgi:hypothetical protein